MRRKILVTIVVASALLITVLVPVVYYYFYVPTALGKQYVSVSFSPGFWGYPPDFGVNGTFEGKPFSTGWLAVNVNASSSYFVPVHVRYDGFDVVWLVYNQTVSDPSDVLNNERFLVWGAYYQPGGSTHDFSENGLGYYANRRELSNYTVTLGPGYYYRNYSWFYDPDVEPGAWTCQYWFNPYLNVPPGTYYMYCIIFGITIGPENLTLTSIS